MSHYSIEQKKVYLDYPKASKNDKSKSPQAGRSPGSKQPQVTESSQRINTDMGSQRSSAQKLNSILGRQME